METIQGRELNANFITTYKEPNNKVLWAHRLSSEQEV